TGSCPRRCRRGRGRPAARSSPGTSRRPGIRACARDRPRRPAPIRTARRSADPAPYSVTPRMLKPLSAKIVAPVTARDQSEARNTATLPTSSCVMFRRSGAFASIRSGAAPHSRLQAVTADLDETALQVLERRERDRVDEDVERAPAPFELGEERVDLLLLRDVARHHGDALVLGKRADELDDVLLQAV